ncbi:MAG: hypothetical protein V4671_18810 [Armatimonadota bacterium]
MRTKLTSVLSALTVAAAVFPIRTAQAQMDLGAGYSNLASSTLSTLQLSLPLNPLRDTAKGKTTKSSGKAPNSGGNRFTFTSTAATKKKAQDAYVARLTKQNPGTAKVLAEQFAAHDTDAIYRRILSRAGLHDTDAADAIAAYTVLGWMIATGSAQPSPVALRGARNQIAARLAMNSRFSDPEIRTQIGEEIKLQIVIAQAGWQSARREGNLKAYSDGVASLFVRQTGQDLRALKITNSGFAKA